MKKKKDEKGCIRTLTINLHHTWGPKGTMPLGGVILCIGPPILGCPGKERKCSQTQFDEKCTQSIYHLEKMNIYFQICSDFYFTWNTLRLCFKYQTVLSEFRKLNCSWLKLCAVTLTLVKNKHSAVRVTPVEHCWPLKRLISEGCQGDMTQLNWDLVALLLCLVFMIPEKLYNLYVILTLTPIL